MKKKKKLRKLKRGISVPEMTKYKPTLTFDNEDMPKLMKKKHGANVSMHIKGRVKEIGDGYEPGKKRVTIEISKADMKEATEAIKEGRNGPKKSMPKNAAEFRKMIMAAK